MRIYDEPQTGGGTRIFILGAAHFPDAQLASVKVPKLPDISSAGLSAVHFANRVMNEWREQFPRPVASIDMLVNSHAEPKGIRYVSSDGREHRLEAPDLAAIKKARAAWLDGAGPDDVLIFYCCGHGIWLPAEGRTFLATSFGSDPLNPWPDAIALDDFAFALGEYPPRQQWLIFDCCNNTPPAALKAMNAHGDPLLARTEGERAKSAAAHGMLSQVIVASSSPEAEALGKAGRSSRFMEAFIDACDGAGCRRQIEGKWWVDQQGIEDAISSYRLRVAPTDEEDYFTFTRVTTTDAPETPRLLAKIEKPGCILLVRSEPPYLLKQAALKISCCLPPEHVANHASGTAARYRIPVEPWRDYALEAHYEQGVVPQFAFAMPPMTEVVF